LHAIPLTDLLQPTTFTPDQQSLLSISLWHMLGSGSKYRCNMISSSGNKLLQLG